MRTDYIEYGIRTGRVGAGLGDTHHERLVDKALCKLVADLDVDLREWLVDSRVEPLTITLGGEVISWEVTITAWRQQEDD